jgi:hypothetical protein
MARDYGKRPSELLEIKDKIAALDVDRACSLRLRYYDEDAREELIKRTGISVGLAFAGEQYQTTPSTLSKEPDGQNLSFDEVGNLQF